MTDIIDCGEFKLYIHSFVCLIKIDSNYGEQGILTFENVNVGDNNHHYELYKWYNEGHFPKCVDTIPDISGGRYRLKIIGVDDI